MQGDIYERDTTLIYNSLKKEKQRDDMVEIWRGRSLIRKTIELF